MDVSVTPTRPEHIESFHRALDIVARERKYLALLEAPPLPQTREFVLDLIQRGDVRLVALAEGEVVGWCDIRRHGFPSRAHRGTLGMGIVPACRGRGLGSRLIRAALAQAWAARFVRVELDVRADNARAIALYDRVGFVREGAARDAFFIDGEYYDVINMAIVDRGAAA
jgi:RimJ/RimL family protein N-acetyltransferase